MKHPYHVVTVRNAGAEAVSDYEVVYGDRRFPRGGPDTFGAGAGAKYVMEMPVPDVATVVWTAADGEEHRETVEIRRHVVGNRWFDGEGEIAFEADGATLRVFLVRNLADSFDEEREQIYGPVPPPEHTVSLSNIGSEEVYDFKVEYGDHQFGRLVRPEERASQSAGEYLPYKPPVLHVAEIATAEWTTIDGERHQETVEIRRHTEGKSWFDGEGEIAFEVDGVELRVYLLRRPYSREAGEALERMEIHRQARAETP